MTINTIYINVIHNNIFRISRTARFDRFSHHQTAVITKENSSHRIMMLLNVNKFLTLVYKIL
jgi:hypothetical protein